MIYPQSAIEDVITGNDIVDIIGMHTKLEQKGGSHWGLCPFHRERTPSFSVSSEKQLYHCFGCGASGNIISFVMAKENYTFPETIEYLADRIHYDLPKGKMSEEIQKRNEKKIMLYDIHKKAARYFYDILNSEHGKEAYEYLNRRKISMSARKKFGIGFSPSRNHSLHNFLLEEGYDEEDILASGLVLKNSSGRLYDRFFNRIMFPIIDTRDRIVGFGGRILDTDTKSNAKYLNSPETLIFNKSNNLYGISFAKKVKTKEYILVEGYMDVISLYQAGFHNVVAALGTSFNESHAKLLKKYANKIIILFDSDQAGVKAVLRAVPILNDNGVTPKVLQVIDAKDPDEYISKFGSAGFANLLETSKSYVSFEIDQKKKEYNLNDVSHVIDFTKETAKILSKLDNEIEREVFIKEASKATGISYEAILQETNKLSENNEFNLNAKRYAINNRKNPQNGLDNARKSVLMIISGSNFVYTKIKNHLLPEEMGNELYSSILSSIYDSYEKNGSVFPADIVGLFEDPEQQKIAASIFMENTSYEDMETLQNLLNDQIKLIKTNYIDESIQSVSSGEEMQKLIEMKRNLVNFKILL